MNGMDGLLKTSKISIYHTRCDICFLEEEYISTSDVGKCQSCGKEVVIVKKEGYVKEDS
jgi:rRNA maturation endonuclease Nob1